MERPPIVQRSLFVAVVPCDVILVRLRGGGALLRDGTTLLGLALTRLPSVFVHVDHLLSEAITSAMNMNQV